MPTIETARRLAASKEYDKLEDLWPDLITQKDIQPDEYVAITDALYGDGEPDRALLLLELLNDHYEAKRAYGTAQNILKHMLHYHKESAQIRKKLINIYRKELENSLHIEEYLELSGLTKNEPIMKAIRRFEDYVRYDIGNYFYFERYGLGQVVDVNPGQREIVIDFEKKKRHFLSLDVAQGVLIPINKDHFLYQKKENLQHLKELASDQPSELLLLLLRSFRTPLSASEIKAHLQGIVDSSHVNKFWERIRKFLEKHDHVKVTGRTTKSYTYAASAEDKKEGALSAFHKAGVQEKYRLAEEYRAKMPDIFETVFPQLRKLVAQTKDEHPGIAIDILMLGDEDGKSDDTSRAVEDILNTSMPEFVLKDMLNPVHQKRVLSILQQNKPSLWVQTASQLILTSEDPRLLDAIAEGLMDAPGGLDDIYHIIIAMPKHYPKQFQWMLKKIASGSLGKYLKPKMIPRLVESLDYVSGVKTIMKSILSLDRFDEILSEAEADEASRILDSVKKSNTLTSFEKENFIRIIEHHFPDLAEEKMDIIYSTQVALKRKREELAHILEVEIPRNKKEIGRAREFGDLSENFEYKSAKEKQDQLYARVRVIESELPKVKLIEAETVDTESVGVGTAVVLERNDDGSLVTYRILGRWDTDLDNNVISNEAPLARSMMGKRIGESVEIEGISHTIATITKAT